VALGISTVMSVRKGRNFGFTVGLTFLALSGLAWWHSRVPAAEVLCVAGGLLILGALLAPARLSTLESAWMRWGRLVSGVTAPILIGVVYFGVITPTGILLRALGRNRLNSGRNRDSLWVAREARRSDLRRQF
jgi:hypothetical protein